jgi:hypothetical protein
MIVNIARTLNRLDTMNGKIRLREWYLTIVDVVDGGGHADGVDDGAKSRSSMSGGGTFLLMIPRAWRRRRRRADAAFERRAVVKDLKVVARECFPKTLFAFSQYKIAKTRVPETCSPKCRCTQTIGMERLRRRRSNEKKNTIWLP